MGTPGLTRDDTWVGVLNEDRFLATTTSMLLSSGLSDAKPILTGLYPNARLASRSLIEDDRYSVIDDRGVLHKVDQINRSTSILADFSDKYEDAWLIDDVFLMGGKAIVLLSTYRDVDQLIPTSEAHSIDLDTGEVTLLIAEAADCASRSRGRARVTLRRKYRHSRPMSLESGQSGWSPQAGEYLKKTVGYRLKESDV